MPGKPKKLKAVAYRFIPEQSDIGRSMYALLADLVEAHHEGIRDARIALAFNLAWTADVDGRVTLGKCMKVGDLHRELLDDRGQPYDFIIILRQEFWTDPMTTDLQRRALLDHELCHAAVKLGEDGEPLVDERQRLTYRIRKHDLEEFRCIPERYGCWTHDLEEFARALERARKRVSPDEFVGTTSLYRELVDVGLKIPIDIIATWTADEKRAARTWAILRHDFPLSASMAGMPPHLAAAACTNTSPSEAQA
jgi:hypothetical protein